MYLHESSTLDKTVNSDMKAVLQGDVTNRIQEHDQEYKNSS